MTTQSSDITPSVPNVEVEVVPSTVIDASTVEHQGTIPLEEFLANAPESTVADIQAEGQNLRNAGVTAEPVEE
jgi:hypothetical protein